MHSYAVYISRDSRKWWLYTRYSHIDDAIAAGRTAMKSDDSDYKVVRSDGETVWCRDADRDPECAKFFKEKT